jgi:ribosomal protein S18 acetylase RimI-like enzyme
MESIVIRPAEMSDIEGIIRLQSANQASQGGSLSGQMNNEQIEEMMSDMPQIVAVIDNEIAGFLLATSKTIQKRQNVPIVNAMLLSYSGTPDAYIYGPICVSEDQRGKGLAQLMFKELLEQEPNREGILLIMILLCGLMKKWGCRKSVVLILIMLILKCIIICLNNI